MFNWTREKAVSYVLGYSTIREERLVNLVVNVMCCRDVCLWEAIAIVNNMVYDRKTGLSK